MSHLQLGYRWYKEDEMIKLHTHERKKTQCVFSRFLPAAMTTVLTVPRKKCDWKMIQYL